MNPCALVLLVVCRHCVVLSHDPMALLVFRLRTIVGHCSASNRTRNSTGSGPVLLTASTRRRRTGVRWHRNRTALVARILDALDSRDVHRRLGPLEILLGSLCVAVLVAV